MYAVLIPLVKTESGDALLLEVRSEKVRQPGEVCFPGGRSECGETVTETAVRETCEELGLSPEDIEIISERESLIMGDGREIHPVEARLCIDGTNELMLSEDEVAEVFLLPLEWLKENPPVHYDLSAMADDELPDKLLGYLSHYGSYRDHGETDWLEYEGHGIWGLTARMLMNYANRGMTEKEKMLAGQLYDPTDDEIMREQAIWQAKLWELNRLRPDQTDEIDSYMHEVFAECGDNNYIQLPFHANWGGHHVHFGSHIYANFNLTCVDDGHIYVGDWTKFGPNVTITTAGHPLEPELRRDPCLQYNKDVHIGSNVWIGAGVVIVPGVSIGDNTVIGAGSVVTKDIPANVVAYGDPCRVAKEQSCIRNERV